MATRRAPGSQRVERKKSKNAHSRFLRTAPSLVALLGIEADPTKSDVQLFNELLADDTKEDTKPKKKKQNNKKKTSNTKTNKKNSTKDTKNSKKTQNKNKSKKKAKKDTKTKPKKDKNTKSVKDKKKKTANKELEFAAVKTTTTSVPTNLTLLKKRAQAELERLADENDDLFHEKETLKIKLNDLQHELQGIKETMVTDQGYKDANDRLRMMVGNYKSELTTLQTEAIMLRDIVNEYSENNDNNTKAQSPVPKLDDAGTTEKMETVKKLVKEKNDILTEFEEMKLMYDDVLKENRVVKKELNDYKNEISALSEKVVTEQDKHLSENKRNAERLSYINKEVQMNRDQLLRDYERKEQQFIQTVEEQLKYIDELENENQGLQRHHTRQVSVDNRSGVGMYSLLRLKTQANIFTTPQTSRKASQREDDDEYSNSGDYSMSFDDEYEILDDAYDNYGDYTPVSTGGDTFVEYPEDVGDLGDVGGALLMKHRSILSGTGYGTPVTGAMSSYYEQRQAALHKELDDAERKKQEDEHKKLQQNMEKERARQEAILLEQKQHDKLDNKALATLVGKMHRKPIEQTSIRALGYFVNKNGRLLPLTKEKQTKEINDEKDNKDLTVLKETDEDKEDEVDEYDDIGLLSMTMDEHTMEQLKSALTIYLFDTLLKYYKFRPKQIGNNRKKKGNKPIQIDYQFKTLLFSSNFAKTDTLFVIIPPYRGGICYWNLCIDKGVVYGTLLPYIEFALSYNNGKCGVLLLDPKGVDVNDIQWSVFKIYDKFIAKRIRSHKLKRIVFIGALKEGNLISHLLDRRGKELKNVVKSCIFLGCDDPYMTKPLTATIYEQCAVNFINSNLAINEQETGTKPNGDKYFIPRKSAGVANFCCIAAYAAVIETVKKALS